MDPGTTIGLALIDFEGTVVATYSSKNMSISQVVTFVAQYGYPVVIAADVDPAPHAVYKLSASYGARLFSYKSWMSKEKRRLGKGGKNAHERDALAAALKAYNKLSNKIRHVKKLARERGFHDPDLAAARVLKGFKTQEVFN